MRFGFLKLAAITGALSIAGMLPAQAALIGTFEGNDCPGKYSPPGPGNGGFGKCVLPADPANGIPNDTPAIIKFNFADNGNVSNFEINPLYSTIDGSEFSFDLSSDGDGITGTGTWTYTPGAGDPGITAFTAKGGNIGFNLYSTAGDYSDVAFTTPNNPSGKPAGLSHITFYDTGGDEGGLPEPGSLALLGLGLVGVGLGRRARR